MKTNYDKAECMPGREWGICIFDIPSDIIFAKLKECAIEIGNILLEYSHKGWLMQSNKKLFDEYFQIHGGKSTFRILLPLERWIEKKETREEI